MSERSHLPSSWLGWCFCSPFRAVNLTLTTFVWLIQTNLCADDLALQELSLALETGGRKMGLTL